MSEPPATGDDPSGPVDQEELADLDEEDLGDDVEVVEERGLSLPMLAILVASALHLIAVVGQHAFVYFDSGEYETLDFSGRSRRPWTVPLLYELVADHAARIVVQGVISAACWGFLALQLARLAHDHRVRWAVLVGILGFSLTTTITNWDTAMLSESLALSLTALILGGLARLARVPSVRAAAFVVAVWVPWIFTRHAHLVAAILATTAVVVVAVVVGVRRRGPRLTLAVLAGGLLVVTLLSGISYQRSPEILDENLALVIAQRVFPDQDRVDWYVDRGMPLPAGVPVGKGGVFWKDLVADREFAAWVREDAVRTYALDLLVHPWTTLTDPLDDLLGDRPPFGELDRPDDVMLALPESYGVGRQVIPSFAEDLLFEPGDSGMAVTLMAVVLVWTWASWRRYGPDGRWTFPLVVLLVQIPTLYAVWHASPIELARHALPAAVILRIALLVQLALLADRTLTPPDVSPANPTPG